MNHPIPMGVMQSPANLDHHIQLALEGDEYFLFDQRSQILAVHELHGYERSFAVLAHIVNADDIRMLQSGGRPGFPKKTGAQFVIDLTTGGHHLDGRLALKNGVKSQVHLTHRSPADGALDLVSSDLFSRHAQMS